MAYKRHYQKKRDQLLAVQREKYRTNKEVILKQHKKNKDKWDTFYRRQVVNNLSYYEDVDDPEALGIDYIDRMIKEIKMDKMERKNATDV